MKKLLKAAWIFAISTIALSSCVEENNLAMRDEQAGTVTFDVVAGSHQATKTHYDNTDQIKWNATAENLTVLEIDEQVHPATSENPIVSSNGETAQFSVTFGKNNSTPLDYWGIYPSAAWVKRDKNASQFVLSLSNTQVPTTQNDIADLLISQKVTRNNQPSADENLDFKFARPVALVEMTIKGIPAGEQLERVKFSTETKDVYLAGNLKYNYSTNKVDAYGYQNGAQKDIVISYKNFQYTTSESNKIYFTSFPVALTDFTVTAKTNRANYTKTVSFTDPAKIFKFSLNQMNTFTVGLPEGTPNAMSEYTLMTDSDKISDGDKIIIATQTKKSTTGYFAMGVSDAKNGEYREATEVTVVGNKITDISNISEITCEVDEVKGIALKTSEGYLKYTGSKNHLYTDIQLLDASYWNVSCNSITNTLNTNRKIQYNVSSPRFACYTGGQNPIIVFLKPATPKVKLAKPQISADLTSENANSIMVSWKPVPGASSYDVTCGQRTENITGTDYTFENLDWNTKYDISVIAKPGADDSDHVSSDPATAIVTTPVNTQPTITFTETNISVEATATTLTIPFTRNEFAKGDVTVEVTAGAEWLKLTSATIANPGKEISCTFDANEGAERTAKIEVSYPELKSQIITVKQLANGPAIHDGKTAATAFTVAEAKEYYKTGNQNNEVWVTGTICGYFVNGQSKLCTDLSAAVDGNLGIGTADSFLTVQLPSGDIRNALNLKTNKGNLGKEVFLFGKIQAYFGVAGLKEISKYELK